MRILVIAPVFCPNEVQFTKNLKSVRSFAEYLHMYPQTEDIILDIAFGGYCYEERYWEELSKSFVTMSASVVKFDKNYGKAYVVNALYRQFYNDHDYIFTFDSDIIFDPLNEPQMFYRLVDLFSKYTDRHNQGPLGAVSLNQKEAQCHWMHAMDCRIMAGNEVLTWSSSRSGIAGGCLFIKADAWKKVGGYKVMGVYSGDDGKFLSDIQNAGFLFTIVETLHIIHPANHHKERKYQEWKYKQIKKCQNSHLALSDDLEKDIKEADSFWNTQR